MGNDGLAGCKSYDSPDQEVVFDVSERPVRVNSRQLFFRIPRPSLQKRRTLVYLNVYHLNDGWTRSNHLSGDVLGLGGAFHAGLEVYGMEWSYGTDGIIRGIPREHEVHVFHESIFMGETSKSFDEVQMICDELEIEWHGEDYDLLEKNCCHFSDALSQELVGEPIPDWVIRFPRIASAASEHLGNVVDFKRIAQDMHHDIDATPRGSYMPPDATPCSMRGELTPMATPCGIRCSPFGV